MAKVAIVTGASKGLGRQIAKRLAAEGIQVVACARSAELLNDLAKEAKQNILPFSCDVTDASQVQALIEYTIEQTGQLDYLINNAGLGRFAPIDQLSEEDWDAMMNVNLKGCFLTAKYAIPHLKKTKGHIVNISSIAGSVAFASGGGYCTSKAGLNMLSEALSIELKPHEVRVTTISPGSIKTEFNQPKDYALEPKQVVDTVWTVISAPRSVIYSNITIRPQVPPAL